MTQYKNPLNVKLPNLQVNKLKSATKNGTELTWNLHQILLVILMGKIIFLINYFVKLLQTVHQLI